MEHFAVVVALAKKVQLDFDFDDSVEEVAVAAQDEEFPNLCYFLEFDSDFGHSTQLATTEDCLPWWREEAAPGD